ncbi:MAG: alpha/beta hydrolase [Phycisphaerales bacterium]
MTGFNVAARRIAITLAGVCFSVAVPHAAAQIGFRYEQIEIDAGDEVALAGTLRVPDADGPVPAVVLITGSGDHVRDQIISGAPMFRWLADHLAACGIATLQIDTRGTGDSTGVGYPIQTTAGRVADVRRCVEFLRARAEIDPARVGLLGHSEGSMIAPLVCERDPAIAFCVLLACPARPGREIFVQQQMLGTESAPAEERAAIRAAIDNIVEVSLAEPTQDELRAAADDVLVAFGRDRATLTPESSAGIVRIHSAPWYVEYLASDPERPLRLLTVPTLAIYGAMDEQTPPRLDAPRLATALAEAGNDDCTIRIIPDEGHFFLRSPGAAPGDHAWGTARLNPDMMRMVGQWIADHTRAASALP